MFDSGSYVFYIVQINLVDVSDRLDVSEWSLLIQKTMCMSNWRLEIYHNTATLEALIASRA